MSIFARIRSRFSFSALKRAASSHKIASGFVAVLIIAGGYYAYASATSASAATSYVLGTAAQGTIVSSVSASGAVAASDQIDLKPKVSGTITWVGVKPGDTVYAGQALMAIDDTDAKEAIASAEASLKTAELQYQKDQAQAPIDYQSAENNLVTDTDNLTTAYTNAFNTMSSTFLDLPGAVAGMDDILYGNELSGTATQWNVDVLTNMFVNDDRESLLPFSGAADASYTASKAKYDAALLDFQKLSRISASKDMDAMLSESIQTVTDIAQTLQNELNFLGKVNDLATKNNQKLSSGFTTLQTNARTYLSTVNTDLSSLLSQKKTLDSDAQAIQSDKNAITLMQVGNASGNNPISLQISAASLDKQRQDLANQKAALADYTIVAPFSGTISAVSVHAGDPASGSVATEITKDQVATLSLNEVDVAKIALGDKATLTFDAIDGLTLTGSVAEIDSVGAVSQGVVSYTVKIDFSSQDARVKPGMTVNAAIQTGVAQNVLMVPSSAVKTQAGQSYVLAFTPPLTEAASATPGVQTARTPAMIPVETGITDGTNIEITSGLTEGQQVVVRTMTATQTTAASAISGRTGAVAGGTRTGNATFGGGAVLRGL